MSAKTLTIRLAGRNETLTVESFLSAVMGAVQTMDNLEGVSAEPAEWHIARITMNSPATMVITPKDAGEEHRIDRFVIGMKSLTEKRGRPAGWPDNAIRSADRLLKLLDEGIERMEFEAEGERVTLRAPTEHDKTVDRVRANIGDVLESVADEFSVTTQLEGRIEQLSLHGHSEFNIYDSLNDHPIKCVFNPDDVGKIAGLIVHRARLRVYGQARYRNGQPTAISVETFEELPEQTNLPTLDDLHRMQIDLTGGEDSVGVVRRLRDAR